MSHVSRGCGEYPTAGGSIVQVPMSGILSPDDTCQGMDSSPSRSPSRLLVETRGCGMRAVAILSPNTVSGLLVDHCMLGGFPSCLFNAQPMTMMGERHGSIPELDDVILRHPNSTHTHTHRVIQLGGPIAFVVRGTVALMPDW